jgi:hypothetical protein
VVSPLRTVPGGEGEPSISVKIGQTLDRVRGEVKDPASGSETSVAPPVRRRDSGS